jgi:hypothetical protein
VASGLYVALVLLTALLVAPKEVLPGDREIILLLLGTGVGLTAAHWLAFWLASHATATGGKWHAQDAEEAGAQVTGGLAVSLLASVPFVVADGSRALVATLLVLATMPAVAGLAIGRLSGRTWARSIMVALLAAVMAMGVVAFKVAVGH